tara:strand:+ start:336 stop:890 length:555 start_codon:yes stop_codon:yes gene_type:complete
MELTDQEKFNNLVAGMDRPIPGQSLTNDPDNPLPFEKIPDYNDIPSAIDWIFLELTEPDAFHGVVDAMRDGAPVLNLAEQFVFAGFTGGKWNPDLMLQLMEPTAYILMSLADKANVVPIIDQDAEPDEDEEINNLEKAIEKIKTDFVPGNIPKELKKQVEELEVPEEPKTRSLLAPDVTSEEVL